MLHEMTPEMETLLTQISGCLEVYQDALGDSIHTLKGQAPTDEEGDVDENWEGTTDADILDSRIVYLQDALVYLENASNAILDACGM